LRGKIQARGGTEPGCGRTGRRTERRRRPIDVAGFDVVQADLSHYPKAIEIYRDRPISYGDGDLINDHEGIGGEFRSDLALIPKAKHTNPQCSGRSAGRYRVLYRGLRGPGRPERGCPLYRLDLEVLGAQPYGRDFVDWLLRNKNPLEICFGSPTKAGSSYAGEGYRDTSPVGPGSPWRT